MSGPGSSASQVKKCPVTNFKTNNSHEQIEETLNCNYFFGGKKTIRIERISRDRWILGALEGANATPLVEYLRPH